MSYIFFDTDLNIAPYWDVVTTGKSVDFVLSNKSLTNPNLTNVLSKDTVQQKCQILDIYCKLS